MLNGALEKLEHLWQDITHEFGTSHKSYLPLRKLFAMSTDGLHMHQRLELVNHYNYVYTCVCLYMDTK